MNDDIGLQHEIAALRTSNAWARLFQMVLGAITMAVLGWVIYAAFGMDGVRIFLIAAGIIGIVVLIYVMAIGVSATFGRQAMDHHNNVLQGLIQFQRADDYGEVARQVASGMSGAMRSGNQVDARVLQLANQLSGYQRQQLADSRQQQQVEAEAGWYNVGAQFDEEVPAQWSNRP